MVFVVKYRLKTGEGKKDLPYFYFFEKIFFLGAGAEILSLPEKNKKIKTHGPAHNKMRNALMAVSKKAGFVISLLEIKKI